MALPGCGSAAETETRGCICHLYPAGVPSSLAYIAPGEQPQPTLQDLPPVAVYTRGSDCPRNVGVEFASGLETVGNQVTWRHSNNLCHGSLQMAPLLDVARDVRRPTEQSVID